MKKPLAVALSGSGFRLLCHIGALQALADLDYEVQEIAGVSGGAIVAALVAAGYSTTDLRDIALSAHYSDFLKVSLSSVWNRKALCSGDGLQTWLDNHLSKVTFKECHIPLFVVATDINNNEDNVYLFSRSTTPDIELSRACRASTSIPFVFEPVQIDSHFLVDGGLSNDLPVTYLSSQSQKVAVELYETETNITNDNYTLKMFAGKVIDSVLYSEEYTQVKNIPNCTVIKITTPPGMSLDTSMTQEQHLSLYKLGYNLTIQKLNNTLNQGIKNVIDMVRK